MNSDAEGEERTEEKSHKVEPEKYFNLKRGFVIPEAELQCLKSAAGSTIAKLIQDVVASSPDEKCVARKSARRLLFRQKRL